MRRFGILILLLAVCSCAGRYDGRSGAPRVILKDVPFIKQGAMECGPACMAMVLNYYGINLTLHETAQGSGWTRKHGIPTWKMRKYPETVGLKSSVYSWWRATPARIIAAIRQGKPVIVRQWYNRSYKKRGRSGHYRVVTGFDTQRRRFYLHDPLGKKSALRYLSFDEFAVLWDMTDHPWPTVNWMLVVEPPAGR